MKNYTQVFVVAEYSGSCRTDSAAGSNMSNCLEKVDLLSKFYRHVVQGGFNYRLVKVHRAYEDKWDLRGSKNKENLPKTET